MKQPLRHSLQPFREFDVGVTCRTPGCQGDRREQDATHAWHDRTRERPRQRCSIVVARRSHGYRRAPDGQAESERTATRGTDPDDRVVLLDAVVSAAGVPEFAVLQRPQG